MNAFPKDISFGVPFQGKATRRLTARNGRLFFKTYLKASGAAELVIANKKANIQNGEREKRANELEIANRELAFQNQEKEKRASELIIANAELLFQNTEKEKRSSELVIANKELAFQNIEKEKRALELFTANTMLFALSLEREKRASELIIANKELAFQNEEKEKRAAELLLANSELQFQNNEKGKRAAELVLANKELDFQNREKALRAAELITANRTLLVQNEEKENRAAELIVANKELEFQNKEKEKRAAELIIANQELGFQNGEKEKRSNELIIANKELAFQNKEKEKRAIELLDANRKINCQKLEKEEWAVELLEANDELKRAEQNIEFDRNNIKSLINNTTDLMWSVDTSYKFITSNQAFDEMVMKISGRPVMKGGSALHAGFSEDKLRRFISYYCRAFEGEAFTETEFTSVPHEFWTEVSFYPIRNEGKVIGTACFSRDITHRKKKENYLKLLESVITNTPDSVLILNTESRDGLKVVFVNKAFTSMTGYTNDEMINKSPFRLAGPKSDLSKLKDSTEAIVNGESCEIEIIQYNKDGSQIWVDLEIASVLNNHGMITHLIVIERDVTEKLKNLQVLKDQNLVLKDIARMQSHDVRGPLASVMGLTNLLINHFDINHQKEILNHLSVCASELDDVITEIVRKAEKANSEDLA